MCDASLDGLCSLSVGGNTVVGVGVNIGTRSADLVLNGRVLLIVIMDVETKTGRVDTTVTPDKKSTKDRLGEEIKDAVEDSLRVGRDNVAALADTPGDRVKNPEECGERTAQGESLANITAEDIGVTTTFPDEDPDNVGECGATEDEVTPLVGAANKSANETGNDHDLIDKDDEEDSRPRHGSGQHQVEKQERSSDEPVDVADVEDLTVDTTNFRVVSLEFDVDGGPAEVGGHREVGDSSDHGDGSSDVVEDTVLARLGDTETQEDKGGHGHDCTDSPVPVGTADGDGNVGRLSIDHIGCKQCQRERRGRGFSQQLTVDVERVVSLLEEIHLEW